MNSLLSGKCPRCLSTEVYRNKEQRGERAQLAVTSMRSLFLTTHLCLDCGYFEESINADDLRNEDLRKKIRSSWQKV